MCYLHSYDCSGIFIDCSEIYEIGDLVGKQFSDGERKFSEIWPSRKVLCSSLCKLEYAALARAPLLPLHQQACDVNPLITACRHHTLLLHATNLYLLFCQQS